MTSRISHYGKLPIGMALVTALASFAACIGACTLLEPAREAQCSTATDCTARGQKFAGAVCSDHVCVPLDISSEKPPEDAGAGADTAAPVVDAGPWGCLDEPPQRIDPNARIDVEVHTADALKPLTTGGASGGSDMTLVAYTPLAGVTVQACTVLDPQCTAPLAATVATDGDGLAHLTLRGDFIGFFTFRRADLFATTIYPQALPAGEAHAKLPALLLGKDSVGILAAAIDVTLESPDAGVGHMFMNAFDCDDRHAPGLVFTIDGKGPNTTTFYMKAGLPSTTIDRTDELGAGGAVNMPVGLATVTATMADTKRVVGTNSVVIRAGEATFAWIRPRVR